MFAGSPRPWAGPSSATDERYATHTARGQHQTELDELIADWTRTLTADELEARMDEHGVPYGKIYRAPEMLEDPHFTAREAIVRVAHPQFGELAMQNAFPKLSDTPGEVRWAGPELGEHTDEVLTDVLGLSVRRDRHAARARCGLSRMPDVTGWRAKVAAIVPSTNTVVEHDFTVMRPPGVTFHAGRMHITRPNLADDEEFGDLSVQIHESIDDRGRRAS